MKLLRILILICFLIPCLVFTLLLNIVSLFGDGLQLALVVFFPALMLLIALVRSTVISIRNADKIEDFKTNYDHQILIRCRSCGGKNKIEGKTPGNCKYCFTKLRIQDRIA